jgi:large subunit ribosomal protein L6
MSRIGRAPIQVPAGVEVKINGNVIEVKGPKGQLSREFHPEMNVELADGSIVVTRPSDEKQHRSLHGVREGS